MVFRKHSISWRRLIRHCLQWACLFFIGAGMLSCKQKSKLDVMVPMPDGVHLATDIYLPAGLSFSGYPALLIRTPYGKDHLSEIGQLFSLNGIAVVAQDTRGLGKSEGINFLFEADGWRTVQDGKETLNWIVAQRWCNGKVATHGWSALGLLEYLLQGVDEHSSLVFQYISGAPVSTYEGVYFPGGMFSQMAVEEWLPWLQVEQNAVTVLQEHYKKDDYWNYEDLGTRLQYITTPAYHMSGWFDAFQAQTIEAFQTYVKAGAPDQHLVIGPWTHSTYFLSEQNELTFPDNAKKGYYIKDGEPGTLAMLSYLKYGINYYNTYPAVAYYTMGAVGEANAPGNAWQYASEFPPASAEKLTISLHADGTLAAGACPDNSTMSYSFSIDNPVPTLCGANLFYRPGPCDVSAYQTRTDMLSFATPAYTAPTEISGKVSLHIRASINQRDTDFIVFLVDIYPDGRQYLMLERGRKVRFRESFSSEKLVQSGEWFDMDIELGYTSLMLNTGHRLGIYLANTNSPKYKLPSASQFYWDDTMYACDVSVDLAHTYLSADVVGAWNAPGCTN